MVIKRLSVQNDIGFRVAKQFVERGNSLAGFQAFDSSDPSERASDFSGVKVDASGNFGVGFQSRF